jgi:tRNA(Ile)-lysidine synthase
LARYEFFEEILEKTNANKIAVAHNKNDKIETILMHAMRGSGIEGLKGIQPKRDNIIRPLLECERLQIEKYCEENQLNPRIDKSNFDNTYTRNKIRNVVIPYIQKEFNPNILETMDRLSNIISQENDYLEKQTQQLYQEMLIEEEEKNIVIDLKHFNLQETVIKSRIIRYIIKRLLGNKASIEKIHIEDIIKLASNNIGNKFLIPNKNYKVLVKNHKLHFLVEANNRNNP